MPAKQLDETKIYQSILEGLSRLNRSVRLDPDEFAKDFLEEIDERIWDVFDKVTEGEI